jgi:adenylosuccinate synthase
LRPQIVDGVSWLHGHLRAGAKVLAEGANAALLDIDFGTYPFCTSSNTTSGGICTGLGVPPSLVASVVGVVKAFLTRVGNGPFPTECTSDDCPGKNHELVQLFPGYEAQQNAIREQRKLGAAKGYVGDFFRDIGMEYGTTTGRPRRCGWLDIPLTKYGAMINGYSVLNLTKLDCLSGVKQIKMGVRYELDGRELPYGCFPDSLHDLGRVKVVYETFPGWEEDISKITKYADLPAKCRAYVERIEVLLECPVRYIGVGAGREAMLVRE